MIYKLEESNAYKKDKKALSKKQLQKLAVVIKKLLDGEVLESKYKDHSLKGKLKDFRDCHIEPDLVLIYKKSEEYLILTALRIGSHSSLGID